MSTQQPNPASVAQFLSKYNKILNNVTNEPAENWSAESKENALPADENTAAADSVIYAFRAGQLLCRRISLKGGNAKTKSTSSAGVDWRFACHYLQAVNDYCRIMTSNIHQNRSHASNNRSLRSNGREILTMIRSFFNNQPLVQYLLKELDTKLHDRVIGSLIHSMFALAFAVDINNGSTGNQESELVLCVGSPLQYLLLTNQRCFWHRVWDALSTSLRSWSRKAAEETINMIINELQSITEYIEANSNPLNACELLCMSTSLIELGIPVQAAPTMKAIWKSVFSLSTTVSSNIQLLSLSAELIHLIADNYENNVDTADKLAIHFEKVIKELRRLQSSSTVNEVDGIAIIDLIRFLLKLAPIILNHDLFTANSMLKINCNDECHVGSSQQLFLLDSVLENFSSFSKCIQKLVERVHLETKEMNLEQYSQFSLRVVSICFDKISLWSGKSTSHKTVDAFDGNIRLSAVGSTLCLLYPFQSQQMMHQKIQTSQSKIMTTVALRTIVERVRAVTEGISAVTWSNDAGAELLQRLASFLDFAYNCNTSCWDVSQSSDLSHLRATVDSIARIANMLSAEILANQSLNLNAGAVILLLHINLQILIKLHQKMVTNDDVCCAQIRSTYRLLHQMYAFRLLSTIRCCGQMNLDIALIFSTWTKFDNNSISIFNVCLDFFDILYNQIQKLPLPPGVLQNLASNILPALIDHLHLKYPQHISALSKEACLIYAKGLILSNVTEPEDLSSVVSSLLQSNNGTGEEEVLWKFLHQMVRLRFLTTAQISTSTDNANNQSLVESALRSFDALIANIHESKSDEALSHQYETVAVAIDLNVRILYQLLGIYGCTLLQRHVLNSIYRLFGKGDGEETVYSGVIHCMKALRADLRYMALIRLTCDGISHRSDWEYFQSLQLKESSNDVIDTFLYTSIILLRNSTSDKDDLNNEYPVTSPQLNVQYDTATYEEMLKAAIKEETLRETQNWTTKVLTMRAWLKHLAAKVMQLSFHDTTGAYRWAREVTSLCASIQSNRCIYDATALIRLENNLLLAEINDQCGNWEKAVHYIGTSMRDIEVYGSETLRCIHALHCVRLWLRIDPKHVSESMNCLLTSELNGCSDDSVIGRGRIVGKTMTMMIDENSRSCLNNVTELKKVLQYRYLGNSWDTDGFEYLDIQRANDYEFLYHSNIHYELRDCLRGLITKHIRSNPVHDDVGGLRSVRIKSSHPTNKSKSLQHLFNQSSLRNNFQVQRFLRRALCIEVTGGTVPFAIVSRRERASSSSIRSFLATASSCFTSVECQLCCSNNDTLNMQILRSKSDLIYSAMQGDQESWESISSSISNYLCKLNISDETSCSAVVSCGLDKVNGCLLIGRIDTQCVFTVAVPSADELLSIVNKWHALIENGRQQLLKTRDLESCSRLSKEEKRQWLDERDAFDKNIAKLLQEFQRTLGPWRVLLSSTVKATCDVHLACEEVMKSLQQQGVLINDKESLLSWLMLLCCHTEWKQHDEMAWSNLENDHQEIEEMKLSESEFVAALTVILQSEDGVLEDKNQLQSAISMITNGLRMNMKKGLKTSCSRKHNIDTVEEDFENMKVTELRAFLKERSLLTSGRKNELIDRAREAAATEAYAAMEEVKETSNHSDGGHVIFVMDETFQCLPVECIPCLKNSSCSRVPNLALLLTMISKHDDSEHDIDAAFAELSLDVNTEAHRYPRCSAVDVTKGMVALDVENNLLRTQERLLPVLSKFIDTWKWSSIVAEKVDYETARSMYCDANLFIFCGHGDGSVLFDHFIIRNDTFAPASLLWGCNSGRMIAHGVHDPSGAALSHLFGGAPFVLGNLWEVTDQDIDRLTIKCLEQFLQTSSETNICNALKNSRDVCKKLYAVGCASVVYGLPTSIKK